MTGARSPAAAWLRLLSERKRLPTPQKWTNSSTQGVIGWPNILPVSERRPAAYNRRSDAGTYGLSLLRGQPTEPSICSSMRRLHSTAYSIGNVLVTGSMKPLTTMPMACSSERPRLIR